MPTLTEDFLSPHFFEALFASIGNGLMVLVLLCVLASIFTFASGATAARHWPKKDGHDHHPPGVAEEGAQPAH